MLETYDDPEGEKAADWVCANGAPPWWLGWLMDEYYWLEKGFLPHGDRDQHGWEYLLGLQAIDSALNKAREDKQERDSKRRDEQSRRTSGRAGGNVRPMVHLNGPGRG